MSASMLSIVIPARNEAGAIAQTVEDIRSALTAQGIVHEIIVVDDGSTDGTGDIARAHQAIVSRRPASGGYGSSLKLGILRARYDLIGITDADGTYPNGRLPDLFKLVHEQGFDMAVGARTGTHYRGTFMKMPARRMFLWLSEYAAGQKIADINSGLRVFRKEIVLRYLHTISNGFSFTTTITLASMLNGYFVTYVPIEYHRRIGQSYVRYWRDSLRTLQIIVSNILYYNPLKLFLLLVNLLLLLSAAAGGVYFATDHPKVAMLAACMAAACFASAFVVAGLGFQADLSRTVSNAPDRWQNDAAKGP
jgi:polyisoprenyl-phosphate glycosyltransferase